MPSGRYCWGTHGYAMLSSCPRAHAPSPSAIAVRRLELRCLAVLKQGAADDLPVPYIQITGVPIDAASALTAPRLGMLQAAHPLMLPCAVVPQGRGRAKGRTEVQQACGRHPLPASCSAGDLLEALEFLQVGFLTCNPAVGLHLLPFRPVEHTSAQQFGMRLNQF